ncbi:MAG: adenosine kinase [Pseudomonadota bacterium]
MRHEAAKETELDVLGIGNAIVDVLAHAEQSLVERLGLEKGAMTLVDEARSEELYAHMADAREVSGGSCANTIAAIADMGGRAAFIGKVRNDRLGQTFGEDITARGVCFRTAASTSGSLTARSMIFVTPDAQRTMQTYLGACVELSTNDIDEDLLRQSKVTYLEGYLWDKPAAKEACLKAIDIAHTNDRRVALTLSDSFCVDRWRSEFLELIERHTDILFANQVELHSLFPDLSFGDAVDRLASLVTIAAITRSEHGSIVCSGGNSRTIAADLRGKLVDTTGAGDLYAAGFLRGLTADLDLERCGRLGSAAAGQIITQYGARADTPLRPLYDNILEH